MFMKSGQSGLRSWLESQFQNGVSEDTIAYFLRTSISTIHKQYFNNSRNDSKKTLILELQERALDKSSLLARAKITSQGSYYRLMSDANGRFAEIRNPIEKSIAILDFFEETYGIKLILNSKEKILKSTVPSYIVYDKEGLEYDARAKKISYVVYYWGSNDSAEIAILEFYRYDSGKNTFKQAILKVNGKHNTIEYVGDIQVSNLKENAATLLVQLRENNVAHKELGSISIYIYVPDRNTEWEDQNSLMGTFLASRNEGNHSITSGVLCMIKTSSSDVDIAHKRDNIPNYIYSLLYKKQLIDITSDTYKNLKDYAIKHDKLYSVISGIYKLYYLNVVKKTLEISICEIKLNGNVIIQTDKKVLKGQCIIVESSIRNFIIRFNRRHNEDYQLIYTIEHNSLNNCLYAVYNGLSLNENIISGKAFFEPISNNNVLTTESLSLYNDSEKIKQLFFEKNELNKYFFSDEFSSYSDNNLLSSLKFLKTNNDKNLIESIAGDYVAYSIRMRKSPYQDSEPVFNVLPISIKSNGYVVVKNKFSVYNTIINFNYNDNSFVISADNPIYFYMIFAFDVNERLDFFHGLTINKSDNKIESRNTILVKTKINFNDLKYRDDVSINGDETNKIDSDTQGILSFLRGASNRYSSILNKPQFDPTSVRHRRTLFFSACYLCHSGDLDYKEELKKAFFNGFAAKQFAGEDIFDSKFDSNHTIRTFREDWKLLIKETTFGSLSHSESIEFVELLWGENFMDFPPKEIRQMYTYY